MLIHFNQRTSLKMGCSKLDAVILFILMTSVTASVLTLQLFAFVTQDYTDWTISLASNLLGYAVVFVPGIILIRYFDYHGLRESNVNSVHRSCLNRIIQSVFIGHQPSLEEASSSSTIPSSVASSSGSRVNTSNRELAFKLVFCCAGLQAAYLTWGVLQEKIMTREYRASGDLVDSDEKGNSNSNTGRFRDSQFLVFVNRILAFFIAFVYLQFQRSGRLGSKRPPMYKYSYCSLSNIMSSWFQYEALKFVTFPTQVLAKASKIIPVMLMGKLVSKKQYHLFEYLVAIFISLGMMIFLLANATEKSDNGPSNTTLSGVFLLLGYLLADAFTSNWQKDLFDNYKMTSMEMMCGVNLFSCLLTFTSLFTQGVFAPAISFMIKFPTFAFDCVLLSVCSAVGQLFIFFTIEQFGPVIFTIIMTLRQAFAIILSCYIYGHTITPMGMVGIVIVFVALAAKIILGQRMKRQKNRPPQEQSVKT